MASDSGLLQKNPEHFTVNTTSRSSTYAIKLSHLGDRDCKAEFLLDFLKNISCDTLYLVGDPVGIWAMKRSFFWPTSHHEVLRKIISIANSGTKVIYIPDNHDELARETAIVLPPSGPEK